MPSIDRARRIGSVLEANDLFPHKVNVSFGKIVSASDIELLVFERGDGLTSACGSGATAAAVAAHGNKFIEANAITVTQRGGSLLMRIDAADSCVQIGSATHVFSGQYRMETISPESAATSAKNVIVYTDGACSGNPGPGGWAAVIISNDRERELCGGEANTTNNRMEMMAAIAALEYLAAPTSIELYTDSTYLKNGITKWIYGWMKNNWTTSDRKPIKNKDLWERLLKAAEPHEISWRWVEGHAGNKFNERVDKLAKTQCKR
jgi:ribonuclease HI